MLLFHLEGIGVEWQEEGLPIPTYLHHTNNGYLLGYAVDGFFGTQKAQEYLNDIIARFLITFKSFHPERLEYTPKKDHLTHYYPKIYKLKELQSLKSLQNKVKIPVRADSFEDYTFWSIKLYCEDLIRSHGIVAYSFLENWALTNFVTKERSTIKAKCRSVWNWYNSKDWELTGYQRKLTDEENEMTRRERAISNAKNKAEKAKKAVINAVTGLYADEYKKKSGKWHIKKIVEATGINAKTASKYLKEFEAKKD